MRTTWAHLVINTFRNGPADLRRARDLKVAGRCDLSVVQILYMKSVIIRSLNKIFDRIFGTIVWMVRADPGI